jgi:hypothetical protein
VPGEPGLNIAQPLHREQQMHVTRNQEKLKWQTPTDPTKFALHYPPANSPRKSQQWDNWPAAMLMDMRLNSTNKAVLTRLAMHFNLKTGDCFPSNARVAVGVGLGGGETGIRATQRAISRAVKLGWLKRTQRRGGPKEKNQTNLYNLALPLSICGLLESAGYQPPGPNPPDYRYPTAEIPLAVVSRGSSTWDVIQLTDGVAVCGPFIVQENAERWMREHGPGIKPTNARIQPHGGYRHDKPGVPTRQMGGTETTIEPPITEKLQNREVIEHSVLNERHRSDFVGPGAFEDRLPISEGRKGTAEEVDTLVEDMVEHFFHNFASRPRPFSAIRSFCQQNGGDITFSDLTALVKAGKVQQSHEGYWMEEEE